MTMMRRVSVLSQIYMVEGTPATKKQDKNFGRSSLMCCLRGRKGIGVTLKCGEDTRDA